MAIELPARIAFLKKIHLFHGLGEDELTAIAEELQEFSYPQGAVIFEQGGKADSFYLIYGGSVRIVRRQNKKEYQLARLVREDYFGEMALVAKRPRSATVTALADTSLLVLSRADFDRLFKQHPQLGLNMEVAIRSRPWRSVCASNGCVRMRWFISWHGNISSFFSRISGCRLFC